IERDTHMRATLICFVGALLATLTGLVPGGGPGKAIEQGLQREHQELGQKLGNVQEFSRFVAGVLDELEQGKVSTDVAAQRVLERARRTNPRYLELLRVSENDNSLPVEELIARSLHRRLSDRSDSREVARKQF